ncbi:hypothetical protein AXF42_Ash004538 [Apostasia shenzhenica]|uniref:Uncharacterized protein n=1 Tax=Apostasia shenzhenica TaxID=1088818 RepID=A0A2I0BGW9_9ASPA|nr:hypothetical protein AXF42_Ash004538 [Apostasia shenzhenica]
MPNSANSSVFSAFHGALTALIQNPKPIAAIIFLVLIPCDLLQSLADPLPALNFNLGNLLPLEYVDLYSTTKEFNFNPISFCLQNFNTVAMAYLSTASHGKLSTIPRLFARAQKSWWKPAVALLLYKLTVLLVVIMHVFLFRAQDLLQGMDEIKMLVMVIYSFSVAIFFLLGDLMLSMSIVASVEEGCYGLKAFRRAWEVVKQIKIKVYIVFILILLPLQAIVTKLSGLKEIKGLEELKEVKFLLGSIAVAPLYFVGKIYEWFLFSVIYRNNQISQKLGVLSILYKAVRNSVIERPPVRLAKLYYFP